MSFPIRPRRSILLVSSANERALRACNEIAADGVIYDLAETVAPSEKHDARERLRDHLETSRFAGEVVVRINGLDTAWGTEDFLAARGAGVDAILMPRVEEPSVVRQIVTALTETDAPESLKLWAMIETPAGCANAEAIAAEGHGRLTAFIVGTATLKLASGVRPDAIRTELAPWLARIVMAAKSHGLSAIDGFFADRNDLEGFAAECASARRMGFDGKTLIHPAQVEGANATFRPREEAIAWARRIVEAFAGSPEPQSGTAALEGRTVDRLHLTEAHRILTLAEAIASREKKSV